MKKLMILLTAAGLCACSGLNKNTVSYNMNKYDGAKYFVVAGEGRTKAEASENALENLKRDIAQNVPSAEAQGILNDLVANSEVDKVWRDKDAANKHYYALAVLRRSNAHKILAPQMDQTDALLAGLSSQFATPADPLADLRIAYRMQPLVTRRQALDDAYQYLSAERASYKPEVFAPYKNVLKEKLSAVLVGVDVEGKESKVMVTYVVDALNKMGLGVVDMSDPDKVITVKIETDVDGYNSKKVKDLIWVSSSAAVSLIDTARGVTFSQFNVYERAGTTRSADSLRRSMQGAGEQAAKQIVTRLEAYLNTK